MVILTYDVMSYDFYFISMITNEVDPIFMFLFTLCIYFLDIISWAIFFSIGIWLIYYFYILIYHVYGLQMFYII